MDILGKIINSLIEEGLSIDKIGVIDTMRSLDRAVFDKKEFTTDRYDYLVLAPVYGENGNPIERVKEAYGVCSKESIPRAQSNISQNPDFCQQQQKPKL